MRPINVKKTRQNSGIVADTLQYTIQPMSEKQVYLNMLQKKLEACDPNSKSAKTLRDSIQNLEEQIAREDMGRKASAQYVTAMLQRKQKLDKQGSVQHN